MDDGRRSGLRRPVGGMLLAGAMAAAIFAAVVPLADKGLPGWEPVDGRVAAALDGLAREGDDAPDCYC